MTGMKRTHIQFSGSLQPLDAVSVLDVLRPAIDRRPTGCGSVLRVQELGEDVPDVADGDRDGIRIPVSEILKSAKPAEVMNNTRWQQKAWGQVWHIFHSEDASISCLSVNAGTRCSVHYHRYRYNQFHVMTGAIVVEVWPGLLTPECWSESDPEVAEDCTRYVLDAGHSAQVQPGQVHRFRVLKPGNVVEVYWPRSGHAVDFADIVRFDEGGADDLSELRRLVGLAD